MAWKCVRSASERKQRTMPARARTSKVYTVPPSRGATSVDINDPNDVVYSVHMNTHAARECSHHAVDNMGEHEKPGRAAPALQSQLAADAQ